MVSPFPLTFSNFSEKKSYQREKLIFQNCCVGITKNMKHFKGDLSSLSKEELAELVSYEHRKNGIANNFCSMVDSLVNLQHFSLNRNKDGPLIFSKINVLDKLTFLDCSFCELKDIGPVCHLKNLKILNCSFNELKSLPSNLCLLQALEKLDCCNCDLEQLPSSICHLKNLKILKCNYNKLTSLPSNIGLLKELKELCCINNYIYSLPDSIGNLFNLKTLFFYNNKISSIPFSFSKLSKNLHIWCTNNLLCPEIPNDWENLLVYLKEKEVKEVQNKY